jgi:hypothetical protein
MTPHTAETDLALYASGDLPVWRKLATAWHVRGCEECRGLVETFRLDRDGLHQAADRLPEDIDWDRLSAEMTANIHVGLAAGECVTPRAPKVEVLAWWRPAAAAAGILVLVAGAWWLNVPRSDTETIGRALRDMVTGQRGSVAQTAPQEDRGPMVGASSAGIELVENGGRMKIEQSGLQPVMYSVSTQGSASTRWVDEDTAQVTITAVYVQ